MRKSGYITVKVAPTSREAYALVDQLRKSGLHPTDVALAAPLVELGAEPEFPIEVPLEEADSAKRCLQR